MNTNVGSLDKRLRLVAGLVIIAAGLYFQSWWGAIGAIPLLTALVGWCPAYGIIGVSTCGTKHTA